MSLLDFHQDIYGPVFNSAGLPQWATLIDDLVPPPASDLGFPLEYFVNPVLHVAFDNFWSNAARPSTGGVGVQDRYAAAWAHVAGRFAGKSGVLGYELMNEPFPGSNWRACFPAGCTDFEPRLLDAFNRKVSESIRNSDKTTIIFYEPSVTTALGPPSFLPPPAGTGMAFSYHAYGCKNDTTCINSLNAGAPADSAYVNNQALAYGRQNSVALFATEWGAFTPLNSVNGDVPAAISQGARELDDAMMSWTYWTYANKTPYEVSFGSTTQGLVDDLKQSRTTPGNVNWDRIDALVRPHPKAVAGTPLKWSFDTMSKVFSFEYSTRGVDGKVFGPGSLTEVYIPKRHYPQGYVVEVQGADVASVTNNEALYIVTNGGRESVTVLVRPRT